MRPASLLLRMIQFSLTSDLPMLMHVEEARGRRELVVTSCNQQLVDAVRAVLRAMLLDVGARVQMPVYQKLARGTASLHMFSAPDGVAIHRTWLETPGAVRKRWFGGAGLFQNTAFLNALASVMRWLVARPQIKSVLQPSGLCRAPNSTDACRLVEEIYRTRP